MLFTWRQRTAPQDQLVTLRQALLNANLVQLASEYCGYCPEVRRLPGKLLYDHLLLMIIY